MMNSVDCISTGQDATPSGDSTRKKKALLIGVSEYKGNKDGSEYSSLPSCKEDIKALKEVLEDSLVGGFVVFPPLINPISKEIGSAIKAMCKESQKDELLLIYFSGHGDVSDNSFYLLGTDIVRADEAEFGISASKIDAWILGRFDNEAKKPISKTHIIILDCCKAAGFAEGLALRQPGINTDEISWGGNGTAILVSSLSTDSTPAKGSKKRSPYTDLLINCLKDTNVDKDGDGWISVEELNNLLKKKAKEEKQETLKPSLIPRGETAHKIHIAGSPESRYRQEVRKYGSEEKVSKNRSSLKTQQGNLGLSTERAQAIEKSVFEAWNKSKESRRSYQRKFHEIAKMGYPLTAESETKLAQLQTELNFIDNEAENLRWSTDVAVKLEKVEIWEQPIESNITEESKSISPPSTIRWRDGKIMILIQLEPEFLTSYRERLKK